MWSHGVLVTTSDFLSSDSSSNLGGTFVPFFLYSSKVLFAIVHLGKNSDMWSSSLMDSESSDPMGPLFPFFIC